MKHEYFGLATMIATMLALVIWLFVIGVSPAEKKPGKLRILLTLVFGFTLTFSGFFAFAFVSGLGSHLAAINMFLFGIVCWQYTLRTIDLYRVARAPSSTDSGDVDDAFIRPLNEIGINRHYRVTSD